jgi:NAD(P)H dehydrogenase (quinone)
MLANPTRGAPSSSADVSAAPSARPTDIRHLIVLGHPDPASFNHAVAQTYRSAVEACGQSVVMRDLYDIGFDPLLKAHERAGKPGFHLSADVEVELEEVRQAAVIVLIYPIWFGMPPAIIKGYVERVLGAEMPPRKARGSEQRAPVAGKDLLIFSTSATTRPWLEENGQWLGLRQTFDMYLQTIFNLAKVEHVHADAIVNELLPHYAGECLAIVEEQARVTCARLLSAATAC